MHRNPAHDQMPAAANDAAPWPDVRGFVLAPTQTPAQPVAGQPGTVTAHVPAPLPTQVPAPFAAGTAAAPPAAPAMSPAAAPPTTWGFPTPNGVVPLSPGPAQAPASAPASAGGMQHGSLALAPQAQQQMHPHAQHASHVLSAAPAAHLAGGRRRMRWETIVPAAAMVCFLIAVGFFIADFPRITGGTTEAQTPVTSTDPATAGDAEVTDEQEMRASGDAPRVDPTPAPSASADQLMREATALFRAGNFAQAAALLHPALEGPNPAPALVRLHTRIDAAGERNRALLAQLARQRTARQWRPMLVTIAQLEKLRPLSRDLRAMRATANAKLRAAKAAMATGGGSTSAPMRRQPTSAPTSGGAHGSTDGHGSHAHGTTNATPPADAPTGSMPPVPSVANTGGAAGTGVA